VEDGLQISVRLPGQQATDARHTVTIREPGTPWPIRFHFLFVQNGDEGTGQVEVVNVGFELGERFDFPPGTAAVPVEEMPAPVDAVTLQRIAANYGAYLQLTRNALILKKEGIEGAVRRLRGPGKKPARLSPDFLRLVAADYEAEKQSGRAPGRALAAKYHANPGTISKWMRAARALDKKEEQQ
jgi:hypothetical protein